MREPSSRALPFGYTPIGKPLKQVVSSACEKENFTIRISHFFRFVNNYRGFFLAIFPN